MSDGRGKQRPQRVGSILEGVLEQCGLAARLGERDVLSAWPEIVGQQIAAHVTAIDLREGVLLLKADHGAWKQELTLLLPGIRETFDRRFGPGTVSEFRWARPWTRRRLDDNQD